MRKVVGLVILTSMMVHSAGRFGALSFLYEKRQAIAYSIGLIAEIPIAMCSSDYDFGKGLKLEEFSSDHTMPAFMQAHEINLFYVSDFSLAEPDKILLLQDQIITDSGIYARIARPSVFHPPLV